MDYKQQVINSADQKYQDLLSGKTAPVVPVNLNLDSSEAYRRKRDQFAGRTEQERKAFNGAIEVMKENGRARYRDKSVFNGIVATTVIFSILIAIILGAFFMMEDFRGWVDNALLSASGRTFADAFSDEGALGNICTIIAYIGGIILFVVCLFVMDDVDSCLGRIIASGIVAGLAGLLLFVVLRIVVFLGGYVLYYLLHPLGIAAFGVIAAVIILILGGKLESDKFSKLKWIHCVVCVGLGVVTALITMI